MPTSLVLHPLSSFLRPLHPRTPQKTLSFGADFHLFIFPNLFKHHLDLLNTLHCVPVFETTSFLFFSVTSSSFSPSSCRFFGTFPLLSVGKRGKRVLGLSRSSCILPRLHDNLFFLHRRRLFRRRPCFSGPNPLQNKQTSTLYASKTHFNHSPKSTETLTIVESIGLSSKTIFVPEKVPW